MIILNPEKLAIVLKSQAPVTSSVMDSNDLANRLIKNLHIQSGFGLAGFLNVESHTDNFGAVRSWVNKQLVKLQQVESDIDWLYQELEHRFLDCMPEMA